MIDAGTARVKRFSFRSKVEQLLVEPVSRPRPISAGRCGRVADGICIRLYDAGTSSSARASPIREIPLSLAGVIRMKALRLGAVEDFPFLERPSGRAIADGYQLLAVRKLGAVDERNEFTAVGAKLAKLPLDPRVGRMILERATARVAGRGAGDRQRALSCRTCATARWTRRPRPMQRTPPSTTSAASSRATW